MIPGELRGPLLGLDEDEGANFLSNGDDSSITRCRLSLQRRFNRGYMFNVNYTLSKSMDTYSDEGAVSDRARPEPARTELGAVRLRSSSSRDSQLGLGAAIFGKPLGRRVADFRCRHGAVGAAVHDHRRGLQRISVRVQNPRPSLAQARRSTIRRRPDRSPRGSTATSTPMRS